MPVGKVDRKRTPYQWDLDHILGDSTPEELEGEYLKKCQEMLDLYELNIFTSRERFKKYHRLQLEATILINRLDNYLHNRGNTELGNQKWFQMQQGLQIKQIPIMRGLADFTEKALEHREQILSYLQDGELGQLTRMYEIIFRSGEHRLDPYLKKFMASYSQLDDSYESIFTLMLDKELMVEPALDRSGKKHYISNYAQFIKTQRDPDRILRENAYKNWYRAIHGKRETLARIMYYQMLEKNIGAKSINFPGGFVESASFADEVSIDLIRGIYANVHKFRDIYRRNRSISRTLLARIYKLDRVKPWDLRMPISKGRHHVSMGEARSMALDALGILGDEYIKNLKRALDEGWIDWLPSKNKVSGAYCIGGCLGVEKKYILLNYNNRLDDVFTLVHELGHAMHAVEFCKHQTHYANTSIFIAEIPSTLNEILLGMHLLDKYRGEPRKLMGVYDGLISGFMATTVGQIIFSEWEFECNSLVNEGKVLDANMAESIYAEKSRAFSGKEMARNVRPSILTVPHFYSDTFYVYKYAVGQVVSLYIALKIYQEGDKEYLKKYHEFLRSGGSKSNLDTLGILGINLESPEIWDKARGCMDNWIKEYKKLTYCI